MGNGSKFRENHPVKFRGTPLAIVPIVLSTMVISIGNGIMDLSIHMATDSAEMEDAVGSEVWTKLQGVQK